jgi:hypothetical protein
MPKRTYLVLVDTHAYLGEALVRKAQPPDVLPQNRT